MRAHDPARAEIDVDFFLHGDGGRASAWALRARVGDELGFAGPRTHWKDSNGADWSLLVADETELPALLAILETLPAGHGTTALAEVSDNTDRQEVETAADVALVWLVRGGRPPGTTTVLADARVRPRAPRGSRTRVGRRRGDGHARGARPPRGARVPRRSMQALGYWKHDTTPEEMW